MEQKDGFVEEKRRGFVKPARKNTSRPPKRKSLTHLTQVEGAFRLKVSEEKSLLSDVGKNRTEKPAREQKTILSIVGGDLPGESGRRSWDKSQWNLCISCGNQPHALKGSLTGVRNKGG